MSKNKTYYEALFEETPEERAIQQKIKDERAVYESSLAFIEHQNRLTSLLNELKEAREKHHAEVREKYQKPKRFTLSKLSRKPEKSRELPESVKTALEAYKALDKAEKQLFAVKSYPLREEYKNYENPVTTKKDLSELLEILVQTCVDFINERKLTDIYSITFGADDLNTSAKYGEWTPATDASIHAYGLGDEKIKGKIIKNCEQKIGDYY